MYLAAVEMYLEPQMQDPVPLPVCALPFWFSWDNTYGRCPDVDADRRATRRH